MKKFSISKKLLSFTILLGSINFLCASNSLIDDAQQKIEDYNKISAIHSRDVDELSNARHSVQGIPASGSNNTERTSETLSTTERRINICAPYLANNRNSYERLKYLLSILENTRRQFFDLNTTIQSHRSIYGVDCMGAALSCQNEPSCTFCELETDRATLRSRRDNIFRRISETIASWVDL